MVLRFLLRKGEIETEKTSLCGSKERAFQWRFWWGFAAFFLVRVEEDLQRSNSRGGGAGRFWERGEIVDF